MNTEISYVVEKTTNRHSRAVYRDGRIIIRLARRLSEFQEKEHTDNLLKRMARQVIKQKTKVTIDPFCPVLDGAGWVQVVFDNGRSRFFEVESGSRFSSSFRKEVWHVKKPASATKKNLHKYLWRLLAQSEVGLVEEWVHEINDQTFGVHAGQIKLKIARSRWGSCSSNGNIMLNTALLFLPHHLMEYVIVHELAHRLYQNHSVCFWKKVESVMADYKLRRKELAEYRLPDL